MLTGTLPFDTTTPVDAMLSRLRDDPVPARRANPQISRKLNAVIMRALERTPKRRYASMEDLVVALERLPGATGRAIAMPPPVEDGASTTARLPDAIIEAGPKLVVTGTGAMINMPALEEVVIGRADPHATLMPDIDLGQHGGSQAGVSRNHARLVRCPEGWLLEDLNSTNGTFVGQTRLLPGQQVRIHDGDAIRCGQLHLVFRRE
jgi:hypothetical protein